MELMRDRVVIGDRAVRSMKGGIEAGHLRQAREAGKDRPDRRQIVRLVQWCEIDEAFQAGDNAVIDRYRPVKVRAAMHDAVSDRDRVDAKLVPQPAPGDLHRRRNVRDGLDRIRSLGQRLTVRTTRPQPWSAGNAVDLALDLPAKDTLSLDRKDLELDARGTCVDDEDRIHRGHAATVGACWRRALA